MCGIVGVVAPKKREELHSVLHKMNNALVHRGPDDDGSWSTDGFAFGIRRLSIIDLGGGHQPIWRGKIGIVMNGEIYNYAHLRTRLLRLGYTFETNSDTEVALIAYQAFGIDFVQHLEGMFAIAILDLERRYLVLVRDRVGKKPLYVYKDHSSLYFASEIKAIKAVGGLDFTLSLESMDQYLSFRYVPFPQTMWKKVSRVPPGTVLLVHLDTLEMNETKYWAPNFVSDEFNPHRDYASEFKSHFHSAVEKRLLAADVPVGIFLSGGLDSTAVCLAAHELGFRNLKTFSVGHVEGGKYDETHAASAISRNFNFHHQSVILSRSEYFESLDEVVWSLDDPLSDLSTIPLLKLSKFARNEVKVVLSGEGADEIFGGYNMHHEASIADRWKKGLKYSPRVLLNLVSRLPIGRRRRVLQQIVKRGAKGYLWAWLPYSVHFSEQQKRELWRPEVFSGSNHAADEFVQGLFDKCNSEEAIDVVMMASTQNWLVDDLLMKGDKITMAASLEARCPFLDHKLIEWAQHLPIAMKTGDASTGYASKRIVRNFLAGRVPDGVLRRPKLGFEVPVAEFLPNDAARVEELVLGQESKLLDYFRAEPIRTEFESARNGSISAAKNVWQLLVLARWLKRWV